MKIELALIHRVCITEEGDLCFTRHFWQRPLVLVVYMFILQHKIVCIGIKHLAEFQL